MQEQKSLHYLYYHCPLSSDGTSIFWSVGLLVVIDGSSCIYNKADS